jgi:hypothetical protein
MAKVKRKGRPTKDAASARKSSKGNGKGLMLMVPTETLQALKVRAAEKLTTARALVLEALRKDGYPVPANELTDRRSRKE